jgi:5-formyltetrahydrofolate cyclo-ligase
MEKSDNMFKLHLRKQYGEKRRLLTAAQLEKLQDLILIQFQLLDIDIPANIMTFSPWEKRNEFNAQMITDYCFFKNPEQVLFYPVMDSRSHSMTCMAVTDDTLFEANSYGIDEPIDGKHVLPEAIDWVLMPLLAFDRRGYRVGYGKGYYDRFLKECRDDVVKIGFSFFAPVDRIADVNRQDEKMDYCITPDDIYRF